MIQFNLLPDVKKEYIKAKRTKHLIISISSLVSVSVLVVLFLLFSFVQFAQKKSISDLTKDIETEVATVKSVEGVDEILTIQNQLNALPALNEERPEVSRIFNHLKAVTPVGVSISSIDLDVTNSTIELVGTANTLALINTYADTLKFATYTVRDIDDEENKTLIDDGSKPFDQVVTDLNRNTDRASYTITLNYDPILFDNKKIVTIIVPNTVTTRSVTSQPSLDSSEALFDTPPDETGVEQ
jgi:Tfp pilus assembly protein PilN